MAEGLGCLGITLREPEELRGAMADALSAEEAVVLDVKTAIWETPILAYRDAVAGRPEQRREERRGTEDGWRQGRAYG